MKIITDSFIKNIVRQSLNENYGLLNEYNITTKTQIGDIPIGTFVSGMTLPLCPDGGFCFDTLAQAKKDYRGLTVEGKSGLMQKYCPSGSRKNKGIKMGRPTFNNAKIASISSEMWNRFTRDMMYPDDIKRGLRSLENFPNFCQSEYLFYSFWVKNKSDRGLGDVYNGFEGNDEYGINHGDASDRNVYYEIISNLFQASISESENQYKAWVDELNKKYALIKVAVDKKNKEAETDKKRKGGGGQQEGWLKEHPALSKKANFIETDRGNLYAYSLNTNDPIVNSYQYGVLLNIDANNPSIDGTYDAVTVKNGLAITIDPATFKFWQFAISQNDAWRYNGVAWSGAWEKSSFKGKLALTTSPDLEDDDKINYSIQTERTKGFRHNLLTEVEYKLGDTNELKPGILKIQQKLGITPKKPVVYDKETVDKVKELQAKQNPPIPVNGIVDDVTLTAIMALPDPKVPSATAWTELLTIGSTGPDVEAIQTKLKAKKGKYGTDTQTAVMNYQKKYTDLPDSGDVDEETFNHIMANTKLGTDIPISYSGKKHNYKKGDWISVKPNSGSDATQLYENNGYFRILDVPDDYTIIIDVDWTKGVKSYSLAGGTTAKVIFGPDAIGGVKTIPTVNDNSTKGSRNKVYNSGTRSKGSTSTGNVETKTRKVARNTEFCNNLIQIKQYLNTNKGGDLTVNCKKTQKTLNQIMLALTGGAQIKPVTPVDQPQYNVVQPESPTNQFL
jgi:hypothetical protein